MIAPKGATRSARVVRYRVGGGTDRKRDVLAVEEPLEIRLAWAEGDVARAEPLAVTMRTPGQDFELVAGFLHGEGVIGGLDDLLELTYCRSGAEQEYNVVEARLATGRTVDWERLRRNFYTSSSCGVCGKASLEAVEAQGCARLEDGPVFPEALVASLPDRLLEGQDVFERTGGLHAAGLFDTDGEPLAVLEDIGRHNAVDKVIGHALLNRHLPATSHALVVSGRASFELVQKSVAAGVPMLVAVGAPSSLAVDLARRFDQTLVGFARGGGFNVYAGPDRIG
jgi:FdhD protein